MLQSIDSSAEGGTTLGRAYRTEISLQGSTSASNPI